MTTRPRDYSKGKIYKLECLVTGKVYIGSTTKQYLSQRLSIHRYGFRQWKEGKGDFLSSFEVMEGGQYEMTLLELYPCRIKDELEARERHWIERMECVNRNVPTRTKKEHYRENVARVAERGKQYYQANAERIAERGKQYKLDNAERIKAMNDLYREKNADRIKQRMNQQVLCTCGKTVSYANMARHRKSEQHHLFLER